MMLKTTSSGWMRWSYLALIPLLAVLMYACNSPKSGKQPANEAEEQEAVAAGVYNVIVTDEPAAVSYDEIAQKPTFNGGDPNEFAKWVGSKINYPEKAKQDGIEGRVLIQFTIGADGSVRDVNVQNGVNEALDAEALRVVSSSPKWEPGHNAEGEAVPVTFLFPVMFKIY